MKLVNVLLLLSLVLPTPCNCDDFDDDDDVNDEIVKWPWTDEEQGDDDDVDGHFVNETVGQDVGQYRRDASLSRSSNYYDYGEVIHLSILFYEMQRSGSLSAKNRIPWRGDSALSHEMKRYDFVGGWYDGGSNMRYLLPMAYSATVLGWGMIEYPDAYQVTGLTRYMLDCLKWAYQFIMNCYPKKNKMFYQFGDEMIENDQWMRPEDMTYQIPVLGSTTATPCPHIAAESAAAMVTCYMVFKDTDSDFAASCMDKAKAYYKYATKYSSNCADEGSYQSTDFGDELTWAAAWLYRATNDEEKLEDAEKFYEMYISGKNSQAFGWNNKKPGVYVLMYALTNDTTYKDNFVRFMDRWLPDGKVAYTPKGLAWISKQSPLMFSAATSFLALIGADLGIETESYRDFAVNQIHYMLGDAGHSYVVGYGWEPPKRPRHRASSCPDLPLTCDKTNSYQWNGPNHHVLYGALVGGPENDDSFEDSRRNKRQNKVACDYNAVFQSAVAGLRHLEITGELFPEE
ncbi:endoglucanase G-like [Glandiceps talaboti]